MSPRPFPSQDAAFEPALSLARQGRFADAFVALDELPRSEAAPGEGARALAFAQLARIAEEAGQAEAALQAVDRALQLGPSFADLHYRRACLLIDRQRRPEARAALDQALSLNPGYLAARLERALLDAREGLLGESLATLRALGREHRLEEPRTFQQGLRSLEHADWDAAEALLRDAFTVADPAVDLAVETYRALAARGEHAEALETLRQATLAHPGYPDLHFLIGCCELEAAFHHDALSSLARALELHPDYHAARIQFARALEALGDIGQAREQVGLVLREDSQHAQALELDGRWARSRRGGRPAAAAGVKRP
jgi:tetratricopeptide (TPR) repeat protein